MPSADSLPRCCAGQTELNQEFTLADRNHDGRINYTEFKAMLDGLAADMTELEMNIGFREVDTDRDRFIDRGEFISWWLAD
jgi:calmodulin